MNIKKNLQRLALIALTSFSGIALAAGTTLPQTWEPLNKIIETRLNQKPPKMKLRNDNVEQLVLFMGAVKADDYKQLQSLQAVMPKTTLELLFAVQGRGVTPAEAEKMAAYLKQLLAEYQFKNQAQFDENTSHIIGRDWHEIDYSGEGMTWQGQKAKYAPYGITNFKTVDNLQKFFPVESKQSYFKSTYQPQKS